MPYAALSLFQLFVITPIAVILRGWALSVIWGWFVVTTFGLPALSVVPAIGVCLVASYLTKQIQPEDQSKTKEERIHSSIAHALIAPPFVVFMGWVINHWMPV